MEKAESEYLFIYSSLRKGFHQDSFEYITRYFNFVCNGRVQGALKSGVWGAVAVPANEDHFIKGELYQLKEKNDFSWVFGQLDDYEGLITEDGDQPDYRREITPVITEEGNCINAWIYWYNRELKESYSGCSVDNNICHPCN